MIKFKEYVEEGKRGLWDNIHAKQERIKHGSGEHMRKPGSKGAPTDAALKASQTNEAANMAQQAAIAIAMKKAGKKPKNMQEGKDPHEYADGEMSIHELKQIKAHAEWILEMLKPDTDMPEWVQAKITLAADYLSTACDYLHVEMNEDFEAQFDLIEEFVNHIASDNNVDPEIIWEELESVSDEELLEAATADAKGYKSKTGGLTQKGRDYYNRTTGAHLKAPVTKKPSTLKKGSKAYNRRKSFCARMSGVEGPMKKPNGEPTRKALALRKWNC